MYDFESDGFVANVGRERIMSLWLCPQVCYHLSTSVVAGEMQYNACTGKEDAAFLYTVSQNLCCGE